MYRKETNGLIKHFDFVLLDMAVLQAALIISYGLFRGWGNLPYENDIYRNMALLMELVSLLVMIFNRTFKNVLKRGMYQEFLISLKHMVYVMALSILFLYLVKSAEQYSRLVLGGTFLLYIIFTYPVRLVWKRILKKTLTVTSGRKLLVVTTKRMAASVLDNIYTFGLGYYHIAGLVLVDEDASGSEVKGVKVVSDAAGAAAYICQEWIDEVFIIPDIAGEFQQHIINEILETGVTVHIDIPEHGNMAGKNLMVENIAGYTVLTATMKQVSTLQMAAKRCMDIAGGLAGCVITGILYIFLAPAIYISSPGPVFFSQERVGRNGKTFRLYKFRSMHLDAEERKAALMEQNKLGDGRMFKMDFDPRVIGNEILPDGTHKTGIGQFIRNSSLDEFPQFWNVLKGEMSLVGTRPPLPGEVSTYEPNHRSRLTIKPGLTGLWQVSGRSSITDFDEVVALDKAYINNWNFGLDIKILMKTVMVVIRRSGAR